MSKELAEALRMALDALDCDVDTAPMNPTSARQAQTWMRAKFGDAARAALAAHEAQPGAGYKLVPIEPTQAMRDIGGTHCGAGMLGDPDEAAKVYSAMLAAAPPVSDRSAPYLSAAALDAEIDAAMKAKP